MNIPLRHLYSKSLAATDGVIGHVRDLYIDDHNWSVRYVVADTGNWLPGRLVLLPPHVFTGHNFRRSDYDEESLQVRLTRKQIEESPPLSAHQPMTRKFEEEYHRYYDWPTYWTYGGLWGLTGCTSRTEYPEPTRPAVAATTPSPEDLRMCSARLITGYKLQASDGEFGLLHDLTMDGRTWTIEELMVETGHWYRGHSVLVATKDVTRINYHAEKILVNLSRRDLVETLEEMIVHAAHRGGG